MVELKFRNSNCLKSKGTKFELHNSFKTKEGQKTWFVFSCAKFGSFIWMCDLMSRRFGNSNGEKYGVRVSWTFSEFSSESGYFANYRLLDRIIRFVWLSTIRSKVRKTIKVIILFVGIIGFVFECINAFEYLRGTRLYISDPGKGIATALFILCIMRCKFFITLSMRRNGLMQHPNNISFCYVLVVRSTTWTCLLKDEKGRIYNSKKRTQLITKYHLWQSISFFFSTFDLVELGYLAQEGFQMSWYNFKNFLCSRKIQITLTSKPI